MIPPPRRYCAPKVVGELGAGGAGGVGVGAGRGGGLPHAVAAAATGLRARADAPAIPRSYGWDPLGLGQDPAQVAKYRSNEILHARWAMLGAAGAIIPEGLAANGADLPGANWAQTGAVMLNGDNLNWTPAPFGIYENPLPLIVVAAIQVGLMGAAEKYRNEGEGPPGWAPGVGEFDSSIFQGLDTDNPGGPFDPLGLADDPDLFAELKVKEIKNGRLAMVSILGFAVATLYTGAGPFENWQNHLADPFGQNLYSTLGGGADRAAAINTL